MVVTSLFEDLLDQYKLEQHVAEKRYTDLYQAYDIDNDRLVRLDIVRDDHAGDASFTGQLVNRARALAQIRHPNIAQVFHIGKADGGAPYVAQATVDGYSLTYRLEQLAQRNTAVNPIYALKLVRQLANALLLAERLKIFHYDLQPDNILVKNVTLPADDTVVLVDLFVPSKGERRVAAEKDHPRWGYLSPEQRAGKEITAASQVYSLGAILYHLLAGKLPGHPVTMRGTAFDRLFGRATALERERPGLTQATYRLVDCSLRKDARGRQPTIEAFAAELDGALAAEELRLGAAAGPALTARRPRNWLVPLLVLALLLAVGAMAMQNLQDHAIAIPATSTSPPTSLALVVTDDSTPTQIPSPVPTEPPQQTSDIGAVVGQPLPTTPATNPSTEQSATTLTPESSPTPSPTSEPTATPTPEASLPRVRVMHNLVNLRRGPGVVYLLLGSVTGGELLDVLAWNNDRANPWYLVMTGDQRIGWIASTVVQAEDPEAIANVPVAATLPPTPEPTATLEPTPTITAVVTVQPTTGSGDLGGGGGGGNTPPPEHPTSPPEQPTTPPEPPTSTPVPIPTDSPSP